MVGAVAAGGVPGGFVVRPVSPRVSTCAPAMRPCPAGGARGIRWAGWAPPTPRACTIMPPLSIGT